MNLEKKYLLHIYKKQILYFLICFIPIFTLSYFWSKFNFSDFNFLLFLLLFTITYVFFKFAINIVKSSNFNHWHLRLNEDEENYINKKIEEFPDIKHYININNCKFKYCLFQIKMIVNELNERGKSEQTK
ncbi:hypothetical protein CP985_03300 [Malaciobacter mytili LMG 24559]|uniref:Uncharacterized protein n=1 Tax=Malaciobacter mytili LMG 24559 TaxID=1032238 RepID=A0AAX2AIQ3_9BACT|nr:hypothetical protein [Malaciobacter mytili]AXH16384.1 putative membrane protein [Malaciobacter mytili LMG 24559]RXK16450.1 hypothetical protein CP985_03300 [Malaciobacter mytili LMG 24559]